MRARVAALYIVLVLLASWPIIACAQNTQTNKSNPLTKVENVTNQVASALKGIAYAVITISAFVGAIHYAMGRGPEWLGKAVIAVVALSVVLWIIGRFIGG